MTDRWRPWLAPACVLAALSAGCGAPPTFTVETTVHPDGSCERTICQPRHESLPAEALKPGWKVRLAQAAGEQSSRSEDLFKPEWIARWKSVMDVKGPPASPRAGLPAGTEDYFLAHGSFRSPREIPPHYRREDDEFPEVGASELERSYERIDRVFVVEHRWSERITDIVTLPGFLEARDKMLDILLPLEIRLFGEGIGPDYDISGLSAFVRRDLRRALEEASVLLYDAAVRHRLRRGDDAMAPELFDRLVALSRRFGFDPLDANGKLLSTGEMDRHWEQFLGRVLRQHVRHRDGSALDRSEVDAMVARAIKDPNFMKPDQRQEERLKRFVGPLVPRIMGLYSPFVLFFSFSPRFEFALRLPGELIETNGVGFKNGRTRWRFTGDQIIPHGYEMKARSLEIDRDGQKKALGRVGLDDEETALEFLELIGDDRSLLEAVRKLKETGDRGTLGKWNEHSPQQIQRAKRLREMLLGP